MAEAHLHHVHLFCSDINATIAWWVEMLGAEVAYDGTVADQRNVFMNVGSGRLHLYAQPPRGDRGGALVADVAAAREAIGRNRDVVVGVKSRLTRGVAADDVEVLRRAQEVATSFDQLSASRNDDRTMTGCDECAFYLEWS